MAVHKVEVWKPIEGYEGLYEVSTMGNVRSLDRVVPMIRGDNGYPIKERILKPHRRGKYLFVVLYNEHGKKSYNIHRLVASAFIYNDDPKHKTTVNHKNEDRFDNRADNLEWCTLVDNLRYGTGQERSQLTRRLTNKQSRPVGMYDRRGNLHRKFISIHDAHRETGAQRHCIRMCCEGKAKTAGGFVWKYE